MSRILIADDDRFLTSVQATAFQQAGYQTSIAHDGHEAIRQLLEDRPDLMLLDLRLPGIDGIGVLKFIRSRRELESLPVFILSNSNYFSGVVQTAWGEGPTKFIRKEEFSPTGLVNEIRMTVPPAPARIQTTTSPVPRSDSAPAIAAAVLPAPTKTALIADDDRTIHSVLGYFLRQHGYEIESAFNGLQALEIARHAKPAVLILDVTMPVKDGFATLAEWSTDPQLREIPVIMLTASRIEEHRERASGQGATHYLTKPFSPDSLVDLANRAVAGGQ